MKLEDFRIKLKNKQARIAIVGFGYIGTCIGAVLAEKGFDVVGIDTNQKNYRRNKSRSYFYKRARSFRINK